MCLLLEYDILNGNLSDIFLGMQDMLFNGWFLLQMKTVVHWHLVKHVKMWLTASGWCVQVLRTHLVLTAVLRTKQPAATVWTAQSWTRSHQWAPPQTLPSMLPQQPPPQQLFRLKTAPSQMSRLRLLLVLLLVLLLLLLLLLLLILHLNHPHLMVPVSSVELC